MARKPVYLAAITEFEFKIMRLLVEGPLTAVRIELFIRKTKTWQQLDRMVDDGILSKDQNKVYHLNQYGKDLYNVWADALIRLDAVRKQHSV